MLLLYGMLFLNRKQIQVISNTILGTYVGLYGHMYGNTSVYEKFLPLTKINTEKTQTNKKEKVMILKNILINKCSIIGKHVSIQDLKKLIT